MIGHKTANESCLSGVFVDLDQFVSNGSFQSDLFLDMVP